MNASHTMARQLRLTHVAARFCGAVGELQLARPDHRNAVNEEMSEDILLACQWLDQERQVKAVVVHGAGEVFCAGLDLALLHSGTQAQLRATVDLANQFVERMASMKAIVVGAIHGACLGAMGIILAAACDLRYAERNTLFMLPEADFDIPAMHTGLRFLAQDLGPSETLKAALLQTPLTAQALHDAAFLNGLCEPGQALATGRDIAADLAAKPTLLLQKSKQHLATSKHELIRATERYHQRFMEQARSVLDDRQFAQARAVRLQQRRLRASR